MLDRTISILKSIPRGYYFFGIFAFLFVSLMVFVEMKNGKFWTNDLKVYYLATQDFFNGNDPYVKPYGLGSGYFKYPPTTLFFFAPLSALGYFWAQLLHTVLLLFSLIGSLYILHKEFFYLSNDLYGKRRMGLLYAFFAFIAVHIVREIHLGNVNLFLLFLFVSGLIAFCKKRENYIVLFWSYMVILKPIVILAFLPLIFMSMYRVILKMAGVGIIFFLIPIIFKGADGIELWKNWLNAISAHGDYIVSENCLKYLSTYYFNTQSAWLPSISVFMLLVGLLVVDRIKNGISNDLFVSWSAIMLAFSPNFFVTDTEHFLLSLPMIIFLVLEILRSEKKWLWLPFTVLMIGYSLQSNDLWGKALSAQMSELGVLGLSNLGLILLFIFVRSTSVPVQRLAVN